MARVPVTIAFEALERGDDISELLLEVCKPMYARSPP